MPANVPIKVNHDIQFSKPPLQMPKPRAQPGADRYSPAEWNEFFDHKEYLPDVRNSRLMIGNLLLLHEQNRRRGARADALLFLSARGWNVRSIFRLRCEGNKKVRQDSSLRLQRTRRQLEPSRGGRFVRRYSGARNPDCAELDADKVSRLYLCLSGSFYGRGDCGQSFEGPGERGKSGYQRESCGTNNHRRERRHCNRGPAFHGGDCREAAKQLQIHPRRDQIHVGKILLP